MRRTQIMQTGLFVDGKPVVEKRKKKKLITDFVRMPVGQ
jgi:hypothetical protein